MEAYSGDQEKDVFSLNQDDLSKRLRDIPQDRLINEIIALWDEVNNLEQQIIKNKRIGKNDIDSNTENNRSIIVEYEEKLRVANIKITRLENQLQSELVSRESLDMHNEKIKSLELEKANLLKNEEELMILIMDMERHMEKLLHSVKEK
jgi:hypothetical protein